MGGALLSGALCVPDLEETALPANAQMTKKKRNVARLPTSSGSQMTKECIREYLSSSCDEFTIHVVKHSSGQQEVMTMVLTSR